MDLYVGLTADLLDLLHKYCTYSYPMSQWTVNPIFITQNISLQERQITRLNP